MFLSFFIKDPVIVLISTIRTRNGLERQIHRRILIFSEPYATEKEGRDGDNRTNSY